MKAHLIKEKIHRYTSAIKRRWYLVLFFSLLTGGALTYWELQKQAVFTSKATFMPGGGSGDLFNPIALLTGGGSGGGATDETSNTVLTLVNSRTIREKVVSDSVMWNGKKTLLADAILETHPPSLQKRLMMWLLNKKLPTKLFDKVSAAQAILKRCIVAMMDMETVSSGMLVITFSDANPEIVNIIGPKVIEKITEYDNEKKTRKSRRTYEFYVKKADSLALELDKRLKKGAQVMDEDRFRIFARDEVPVKKAEGDIEMLKLLYSQVVTIRETSLNELMKDTPVLPVIDHPTPPFDVASPSPIKMGFVGLIAGIFLGIFLSIFKLFKEDFVKFIIDSINSEE